MSLKVHNRTVKHGLSVFAAEQFYQPVLHQQCFESPQGPPFSALSHFQSDMLVSLLKHFLKNLRVCNSFQFSPSCIKAMSTFFS